MIEYMLEEVDQCAAPPTPEAIEQLRLRQLEALRALRRRLLEIHSDDRSAA
jgi:hypothetical protein